MGAGIADARDDERRLELAVRVVVEARHVAVTTLPNCSGRLLGQQVIVWNSDTFRVSETDSEQIEKV